MIHPVSGQDEATPLFSFMEFEVQVVLSLILGIPPAEASIRVRGTAALRDP